MQEDSSQPLTPDNPKPLDYAHGTYNPPTQRASERAILVGGGVLGFLIFGFIGGLIHVEALVMAMHNGITKQDLREMKVTLAVMIALAVVLLYLGGKWRRREVKTDKPSENRFPGWQGFIIGAGLALLISGGCYARIL